MTPPNSGMFSRTLFVLVTRPFSVVGDVGWHLMEDDVALFTHCLLSSRVPYFSATESHCVSSGRTTHTHRDAEYVCTGVLVTAFSVVCKIFNRVLSFVLRRLTRVSPIESYPLECQCRCRCHGRISGVQLCSRSEKDVRLESQDEGRRMSGRGQSYIEYIQV